MSTTDASDTLNTDVPVTLSPVARRRRRRVRLLLIAAIVVSAASIGYYYAFNNWSMHQPEWVAQQIEIAIDKGLAYLDDAGTFGMVVADGGEPPPHHFFLDRVLAVEEHPGLRAQTEQAHRINADNWEWQAYLGIPGWREPRFSGEMRQHIKHAVSNSPKNPYGAWLLHAIHPRWTHLPPKEEERLFYNTRLLKHSYHLTHALMAYLWLKQTAPDIAEERHVDRLIEEVNRRLYRIQCWDARTSDIYNERVAFWLYMEGGPPVRQRWIERILLSQNPDGGWTFGRSIARTIKQMISLSGHDSASDPHSTFLALYTLVQYRELLRQEGIHVAGR